MYKTKLCSLLQKRSCPLKQIDEMKLRILNLAENKADWLFKSDNCQTLLKMYDDFYPKIGFNLPWVAYLILQQNQVVGLGSFKGQPK